MKCQRCESENKDFSLVCITCGEVLRVFCQLCKNYTFANRTNCEFCGFKLEKDKKD